MFIDIDYIIVKKFAILDEIMIIQNIIWFIFSMKIWFIKNNIQERE